jgi:hypothetical protein
MPRGRLPKISPIPFEVLKSLHDTGRRIGPAPLPQTAALIGYAWLALTERIRRIAPDEYPLWSLIDLPSPPNIERLKDILLVGLDRFRSKGKFEYLHVCEHLAAIATVESLDPDEFTLEDRHKALIETIEALMHGKASEENHSPATISVQRDCLIHFLIQEECPALMAAAVQWVEPRWPVLMTLVLKSSCRCPQQNRDFDGFASIVTRYPTLPPATLAEIILSHLHGIDRETVRGLHKHS